MDWSFDSGDPLATKADATILPISKEQVVDGSARISAVDSALNGHLIPLMQDARFTGKSGSTLTVPTLGHLPTGRIVLVGVGPEGSISNASLSTAYGAAALAARTTGATSVVAALPFGNDPAASLEAAAVGIRLALYEFRKHRGTGSADERQPKQVDRVRFVAPDLGTDLADKSLRRAQAIAEAVELARDLVNEPASVVTPEAMAAQAVALADRCGLEVEVLDENALRAVGANAILAVGMGSAHKPRMIRLRYQPENRRDGRVVGLVGKCITFDTGGYSIKTYEGMLEMKGDMAGGAAVLGTMSALRSLGCPVPVEATICAAENMISGEAFRPGDILTAMNGVTIEVLSTDAEGRLVLADGLVDTARRGATELIDLATLTGAAVVALGEGTTALFSSSDQLADTLLASSREAGERMWRMPLIDDLNEKIKGDVGDIKNSGGRGGGAITAALFLQRFSEGLPWAHLDIAGSARLPKAGPEGPKGASGVGVRTLVDYLCGSR